MNWYYAIEGLAHGPVTEGGLKQLASEGVIHAETLIWQPGREAWEPMAQLKPEIVEKVAAHEAAPAVKNEIAPRPDSSPGAAGSEPAGKGLFKRLFGRSKN